MKRLVSAVSWFALCALCVARCACAEDLPRNPFWPQGFEGTRHPISAEPRIKPKPPEEENAQAATNGVAQARAAAEKAKAEAAKKADPLEDAVWDVAVKALRFGSAMGFSANGVSQAAITINGSSYAVGELVSANFEGRRFTWKIEGVSTDGKIKLKRLNHRKIGTNP